jgi:deoxyribodipyrimidine photo-lyase
MPIIRCFRVYNPGLQSQKFDREGEYVRRWNPDILGKDNLKPIVDHVSARQRAISAYRSGFKF